MESQRATQPSNQQKENTWKHHIATGKTPEPFISVGTWYDDFSQTTDEEVTQLLNRAKKKKQNEKGHSTMYNEGNNLLIKKGGEAR